MIIGYDGSRAFVKNRTGTENYSFQLLKNLLEIDKKNSYIVYLRPGSEKLDPISGTNPRNFNSQNRVKYHFINYYRLWTQIGLSAQTFKDNLDILFVPAHTLPIIRRPNLKTVVTVHDLGSEFLPKMHRLKQRLYLSFMQRQQLKGATKIIAVSKATKTDLISKVGIDDNKVSVVYEGFDQDLFRPIRGDILNNSLKGLDLVPQNYFLFVGTVQPRKNLERLIKAYAFVVGARHRAKNRSASHSSSSNSSQASLKENFAPSNYRQNSPYFLSTGDFDPPDLVIVGSKGWLADEIYQLPKKLGIEKRVKFIGRVDDEDLPALYSGAIALVFPSLFEGFGLPIIEAQACGCPVITSSISSMPEVAGKAAILIDPYDIESIYKALVRVQNQESRIKLIRNGFLNIKRFSWEKCAKETLQVFESLQRL